MLASQRPRALLVTTPERRERLCDLLADAGYDPLAFDDVGHAMAWLEEETPAIALMDALGNPAWAHVMAILRLEDVRLVQEDELPAAGVDRPLEMI